jgi:hypothetical protein
VVCQQSSWLFTTLRVSVTVGAKVVSAAEALLVDVPSSSIVQLSNRPGTGSMSVMVHHTGFGSAVASLVGGSEARGARRAGVGLLSAGCWCGGTGCWCDGM